jgi:hypothetical protein
MKNAKMLLANRPVGEPGDERLRPRLFSERRSRRFVVCVFEPQVTHLGPPIHRSTNGCHQSGAPP